MSLLASIPSTSPARSSIGEHPKGESSGLGKISHSSASDSDPNTAIAASHTRTADAQVLDLITRQIAFQDPVDLDR